MNQLKSVSIVTQLVPAIVKAFDDNLNIKSLALDLLHTFETLKDEEESVEISKSKDIKEVKLCRKSDVCEESRAFIFVSTKCDLEKPDI